MGRRSAGAALETSVRVAGAGTDECDGPLSSSIFGRRTKSAGRLLGIAPSTGGLTEALEQLTIVAKHNLRAADAQRKAAAFFESHVRHSNNAAVADVGQHQANLLKMEADIVDRSARDLRKWLAELRKINDAEKEVRERERVLVVLHEKRVKIADSLRKGGAGFLRRRSEDDTLRKRQQLAKVDIEIEEAEAKLDYTRKEMEIAKMFHYRIGMQGIADSAISYASTTAAIFGCFREITEMVPAISTQDIMTMNYDGADITRNCVSRLRRDIAASTAISPPSQLMGDPTRRRTGNYRTSGGGRGSGGGYPAPPALSPPAGHGSSTPPPPYTPTAPSMSEMPQPGGSGSSGGATVVVETSSTPTARPSPPRFNQLYPRLPANPYRRGGGLHS